ncbi:MAG: monofunctional biosynthetic peptidoglycan transglycosylase [Prevotellaceae bacterium]|nr:monofunctional biosynthetic peptidoglycan transglycosylase [Prevotellaceae bacterium]
MNKQRLLGKVKKVCRSALYGVAALWLLSVLTVVLYRWVNPPFTPLMLIRKATHGAPIHHRWVDMKDISPHLVNCVVASEDNNFLGHRGFDFGAIRQAIQDREKGRIRGASTISQQTAKNLFLWQGKSWLRKGLEVYFTFLIETLWSKERIMEMYLNEIEMGVGIYGAEAAAQHYFKKSARQLSLNQAALVVAAFPNPLQRNPAKPTPYLSRRARTIVSVSKKIGVVKFDDDALSQARKRYKGKG